MTAQRQLNSELLYLLFVNRRAFAGVEKTAAAKATNTGKDLCSFVLGIASHGACAGDWPTMCQKFPNIQTYRYALQVISLLLIDIACLFLVRLGGSLWLAVNIHRGKIDPCVLPAKIDSAACCCEELVPLQPVGERPRALWSSSIG